MGWKIRGPDLCFEGSQAWLRRGVSRSPNKVIPALKLNRTEIEEFNGVIERNQRAAQGDEKICG